MSYHVLIAAGGTGGHIIPAQVVAEDLFDEGVRVSFAAHNLSNNPFFNKERFCFYDIQASPFSLTPFGLCRLMKRTIHGFVSSLSLMDDVDLVVGFGSYHALPILLAAAYKKKPFVLYEANSVPGRVIRLTSPLALYTACPFEEAMQKLRGQTKNAAPILRRHMRAPPSLEHAKDYFGLPLHIPTILVMGGSQGARSLNSLMPKVLSRFSDERKLSVIHLAGGKEDISTLMKKYKDLGVLATVKAFESKMEYALAAANVVVSRAGASAISEIEAFQKPAIYIPYPEATDDHQRKNALSASFRGTAVVINEEEASPDTVFPHLAQWLYTHEKKYSTPRKKDHFVTMILETLKLGDV
jgi:UDP-N-acetylglucosamine--N-acetylmuramyl-(pentapeptide) pyrophosphoryl-undecaprenol N-acetylglucosamine transferase